MTTEREWREKIAAELEAEAAEYEAQFGTTGKGGLTSAVLVEAARLVRSGPTPDPAQSPIG